MLVRTPYNHIIILMLTTYIFQMFSLRRELNNNICAALPWQKWMRDTCDVPLLSLLKPMRPVYLLWGQDWLLNWNLVPLGHSINNDLDWCPKPLFYWVKACHICLCQLLVFKLRKSEYLQIQEEAKATTVDTTCIHVVNYASSLPAGYELSRYWNRTI